jgi:hypothetical protein
MLFDPVIWFFRALVKVQNRFYDFLELLVKGENQFFDFDNHWSRVYIYHTIILWFQVPKSENLPTLVCSYFW